MGLPPLMHRELRSAARNRQTYRIRLLSGVMMALVSLAFIFPGAHNAGLVGSTARSVFWWIASLTAIYGMTAALFFAGDALASERRQGTLELLRLTRLHTFDILLGKLVANGLGALQAILAFSLTLALAILAGGVTLGEFTRAALLILNSTFLALTVGLCCSCLVRDGRAATIVGFLVLIVLSVVPLAWMPTVGPMAWAGPTPPSYSPGWLETLSPIVAFRVSDTSRLTPSTGAFWTCLFCQHALGWAILGIASFLLSRFWRGEFAIRLGLMQKRVIQSLPLMRYAPLAPAEIKEENPIEWLLASKYGGLQHRIAVLFALGLVSVCVFVIMCRFTGKVEASFVVLMSWHVFLKLWVAWAASHLMTEMRRSGMLELTLTTPMDWRLILDGWLIGLKRVFLGPVALLFAGDCLLAYFAGPRFTSAFGSFWWVLWMIYTLFSLAVETYALTWIGIWRGVQAKNTLHSWMVAVGIVLLLPWFCVAALFALTGVGFIKGISVGPFDFLLARAFFGALITIGATAWAIDQLRSHVRENLVR